jgi:predicted DNA-binding transcriptional regulator AlpA
MRKESKAGRARGAKGVASSSIATSAIEPTSLELVDATEARAILGGSRPLSLATFYRQIQRGQVPKAILIAPNCARWLRCEVLSVVRAAINARAAEGLTRHAELGTGPEHGAIPSAPEAQQAAAQ